MGLSASQARLLTITARKADCEFLSMNISHQKLALARTMENVSDEYQEALNRTKLVYDFYGTGTDTMPLNYGLLMKPSMYNDYTPRLLTDSKERVVLNSAIAAAAKAAGIPAEGLSSTASSTMRNAFMEALAINQVISPSSLSNIVATPYSVSVGLGETVSVANPMIELSGEELIKMLGTTVKSGDYTALDGKPYFEFGGATPGDYSASKCRPIDRAMAGYPTGNNTITQYDANGKEMSSTKNSGVGLSLSIADLLDPDSNYVWRYSTEYAYSAPVFEVLAFQNAFTKDYGVLDWMSEQFASVLSGPAQNELALQYAYDQVYNLVKPNNDLLNTLTNDAKNNNYNLNDWYDEIHLRGHRTRSGRTNGNYGLGTSNVFKTPDTTAQGRGWEAYNAAPKVSEYAMKVLGYTDSTSGDKPDNKGFRNNYAHAAISLSNLAKMFLSAYLDCISNFSTSYKTYPTSNIDPSTQLYNYKNDSTTFTIYNPNPSIEEENMNVTFYDTLFNLICTSGWSENDKIDNAEYMQELMKNGLVFISSMSNDGFYYQGSYSTDRYIQEVADDTYIAQAEAKYNSEKAKIENKEDTLDMKMKNLDTEISALTQEYETVKGVINKTIEKAFKRYEA